MATNYIEEYNNMNLVGSKKNHRAQKGKPIMQYRPEEHQVRNTRKEPNKKAK